MYDFGLYSDMYKLIFFKLGMIIETTQFYILISVVRENKNSFVNFHSNFAVDLDEIQYAATTGLFVKPIPYLICRRNIQEGEL